MLNFLSLKQSNELGRCFVLDYFTNLDESVLDELVRSKQQTGVRDGLYAHPNTTLICKYAKMAGSSDIESETWILRA
jgi:hypothetical protein